MKLAHAAAVVMMGGLSIVACRSIESSSAVGMTVQTDPRAPQSWRALTPAEQKDFDLGYAVFNTEWSPANQPAGRRDGLGPLFNVQSCDACHNSRRRGRGPRAAGTAPGDLVMQLGVLLPDGSVQRGNDAYGHILNTNALPGFEPEAAVAVQYDERIHALPDGSQVSLRKPDYRITRLSGAPLPANTVLMPRMPPSAQGSGLLEQVPEVELVRQAAALQRKGGMVRGEVAWITTQQGRMAGRFGWQATESTVVSQTATALSREMGLTTSLVAHIDCGSAEAACRTAPSGGTPEVESELFDALVLFQRVQSVPVAKPFERGLAGERMFVDAGCAACHRLTLPVDAGTRRQIHAFTDLLLHDLGKGLADRDMTGAPVRSTWRTAPLWGMNAAYTSGQPLRLLHDGRARSIEEAILWHDGEARDARLRFERLPAADRALLAAWIAQL